MPPDAPVNEEAASGSLGVLDPILNSPFEKPKEHWLLNVGEEPRKLPDRRPSLAYPPQTGDLTWTLGSTLARSVTYRPALEMTLVNRIRQRVEEWREQGYPGVTRTTLELLQWWTREGRKQPLFFAQVEAAETILFLSEARAATPCSDQRIQPVPSVIINVMLNNIPAFKHGAAMPFTPGHLIGADKRWRKGESGNPRGRSRIDFDLAEVARTHSPAMLQVAVDIAMDPDMPPGSRLRAVELILSRGHGRPLQALAVDQRVEHVDATKVFIEALKEHSAKKLVDATPTVALPVAE